MKISFDSYSSNDSKLSPLSVVYTDALVSLLNDALGVFKTEDLSSASSNSKLLSKLSEQYKLANWPLSN